MNRPSNWYEMDDDARRAWVRAEREAEDLEYECEESRRRAERSERAARDAREHASVERDHYLEQLLAAEYDLDAACFRADLAESALAEVCLEVRALLAQLRPPDSESLRTVQQLLDRHHPLPPVSSGEGGAT